MNVRLRIIHHGLTISVRRQGLDETKEGEHDITIDLSQKVDQLIDDALREYDRQRRGR